MKNRNENGNENGYKNRNENANVSSMVNEVIRTILFFSSENFISIKSTKRHINKQKYKKTSKKKSLVCLFTSYALHIKNI